LSDDRSALSPPKPLPVDADATVRALQTGLAGLVAAAPLTVGLAAEAGLSLVAVAAAPILVGALGAIIGYRFGRHG